MTLHVVLLPLSEERDEEVALEFAVKNLGEEVQVGDESCLQNDGNVAGVEQLNGVRSFVATHSAGGHSQFDAETLEVNNDKENDNSSKQVANIRRVLSVESLLQSASNARFCEQEMEQSDNGTFEFGALLSADGNWGEGLP